MMLAFLAVAVAVAAQIADPATAPAQPAPAPTEPAPAEPPTAQPPTAEPAPAAAPATDAAPTTAAQTTGATTPATTGTATTGTATTQTTGAVVSERPNILVLDFRDDGVGPSAVRIIHDTLVSHVSKDTRLDVLSSEDVRRAVQLEAERREVTSCDQEGCIAEIAEALGAQLTLFGTAGKLGDLVVVNVNLYDARAARSVGRETIEVASLEELPDPLRKAGDKLIAQLFGEPVSEGPAFGPLFWTGSATAVAGLATAVVGASVYAVHISAVSAPENDTFREKTDAKLKQDAGFNTMLIGIGVLAIGGTTAGVALAIE